MKVTKITRLLMLLFAILFVPKWIQAQAALKSNNGTIQQSLQNLLAQTSDSQPAASPFGRPVDPSPVSTHEKFATFLSDEDFKSVLLLENFRPDLPIIFTPILMLGSGEVPLDSVTVPAHSSATVDISAIMQDRGFTDARGTVAIRYNFTSYGPGSAVIQISDEKHHLYLNSYAQSSEEYWSGTTYDAVVWTPNAETQGFISVTNSSKETHVVHATFSVNGRSEEQRTMQIPPRQTRILMIDDLLKRSLKSGAGIHIEYEQEADETYTGAILVEGQLFNKKTGFAKNIHFMDKALPPTGTLRTHFLMLGSQPAEDNFPADVAFQSVAAVRNIDSVPILVVPTIKFLRNQTLQTISLPSRSLAPMESVLINFSEEQKAGHLPLDFTQGSLELVPNTGRVSIVGELFNFSQSGAYVVGPSFSSYPNRSTASVWRTDGSFQTTIIIENTASQDDRVTLSLYSERGTYKKTFAISAGKLLKVNIRDLQQNAVPDDGGKFLLDTSGILSLVGSRNTASKLSYDKIVHNTDEADYVGFPISSCDFVSSIAMWIDASSGTQPFPVMKTYYWTQSGAEDSPQSGSSSSNTGLAQISNNGSGDLVTFSSPSDGITHSVTINPPFPQENATFCDACSAGLVTVSATGPHMLRIALTSWGPPPTSTLDVCTWHNLACSSGTPACTIQIGFIFTLGCPSFVQIQTLVVDGACIPPNLAEATTGPGACN